VCGLHERGGMRKPRKPLPRPTKPIARYTPLANSSKPIARSRKPIAPRRKDPSKRAWAKHRDPAYQKWIKTLPCLICGSWPVDPAHVIKRSRGAPDRANIVPLCRTHHSSQEGRNAEFEEQHGVDLTAEALRLDAEYEALAA
jgi:hypothetical protein